MSGLRRAGGPLLLLLARRLLGGRRSGVLTDSSWAALGSIALGVVAMVVATALMNGYTGELVAKMVGGGALVVAPVGAAAGEDLTEVGDRLLTEEPEIVSATTAVLGSGSLSSDGAPQGLDVSIRGIDAAAAAGRSGAQALGAGPDQLAFVDGVPGAVLGAELAARLGVEEGDRVRLVALDLSGDLSGPRFRYRSLRVGGTFRSGFSLFDAGYLIVDRELARTMTGSRPYLELGIDDPERVEPAARRVRALLGDRFVVRDWRDSNPGLFTALRLQKWALFLIMGLIVVVSTFNVVSTLIVLVREKTRQIGTLVALGLSPHRLRRVFLLCGLLLGVSGAGLGLVLGIAVSMLLSGSGLLRFDAEIAEIYFIDRVPLVVLPQDLLAITLFAVGVTAAASWLPARRAARVRPVEALRYE